MKTPNFSVEQFVDAIGPGGLNAAYGTVSGAISAVTSGAWAGPGIIAPDTMAVSFSGNTTTTVLSNPWCIVTSGGIIVHAHGTVTNQDTQTYTNNFTSLLPASGTLLARLVASIVQIQQNPISIPGPPNGHPSFNPNFVPTVSYASTVYSVALTATSGTADNINTFELFRTTLTAGQSAITAISQVGAQRAPDRRAWPPQTLASGGVLTVAQAQSMLMPAVSGLTSTLPPVTGAGGTTYGLINPTNGNWTISATSTDRIVGVGDATVASFVLPASGTATLWGDAAFGIWRLMGTTQPGRLLNIQVFSTAGSFTYTPTAGTNSVIVEVQGAGAAGGGCITNIAGNCSAGAPGASGAYGRSRITSGFAGTTVTVGANGVGAAGVAGGNGGTSSFGAFLSAPGGPGGAAGLSQNGSASGGNGGAAQATGANLFSAVGMAPSPSFGTSTGQLGFGGAGGASFFGPGGIGSQTNISPVTPGISPGSGGGGTFGNGNTSTFKGADGADGIVIVWEYG
jgi:hypothetical protein